MTRRRIFALLICFVLIMTLVSCNSKEENQQILTDKWNGDYVWENSRTEEFKILRIQSIDEKKVNVTCESARDTEIYEASIKSQQGRYIAVNLGSRSVKLVLSPQYQYVLIDDMWTGENPESRDENWSGKYRRLEEGEELPPFGNPDWNGKYICEETGTTVSVYGIKERYVLFSYITEEDGEKVENSLTCLESDPTRAVYTKDERLVMLDILKANEKIQITDMYMNDRENTGISGVYKKLVEEESHGE